MGTYWEREPFDDQSRAIKRVFPKMNQDNFRKMMATPRVGGPRESFEKCARAQPPAPAPAALICMCVGRPAAKAKVKKPFKKYVHAGLSIALPG